MIASELDLLVFSERPTYTHKSRGVNWRNERELWGAWHKPNYTDRHKTSCFDVKYISNNVGARDDVDYTISLPGNAIALIGDSFAEGWGVKSDDTFAKIIEKKTNFDIIIFR